MVKITGYVIQGKIHETTDSTVYRAIRESDGQVVAIRHIRTSGASPSEIARFSQEYEEIKLLDIHGLIRVFDLIQIDGNIAIVQEFWEGRILSDEIKKNRKLPLPVFLDWAVSLSRTLGELHGLDKVHLAVSPYRIIVSPDEPIAKLADFGVSDIITHLNDEIYKPIVISRILPYMSPEQTGRMTRGVDYRTDLYSLGVTFYEMLTGSPPFAFDDPMAIIHAHMALEPPFPGTRNPDIPYVVSEIILKLLSKSPESRYQNAFGLMADLEECIKQQKEKRIITPFPIGKNDQSPRFVLPHKLYGREKDVNLLLNRFDTAAGREKGTCVMVVSGPPGIGKSAVIHEITKPVVARRGFFISGKYDQGRKEKAYSAIIEAFGSLVRQILSGREDMIEQWKETLVAALGGNLKAIIDVIPEMEMVVGPQNDLSFLVPDEAKNRFNYVFEQFISVVSTQVHPLTLFLDDTQWADPSSFDLLDHVLSSDSVGHFFLILSFRDNVMERSHPLMDFISHVVTHRNVTVDSIFLSPLGENDIGHMLVDLLKCPEERVKRLAELVHKKTGGNPFFVTQFLKRVHSENLVVFNPSRGWMWDEKAIDGLQMTENLIELMEEKISTFPPKTLEILKIWSCIGNGYDLETLADVSGNTVDDVIRHFAPVLNEGM